MVLVFKLKDCPSFSIDWQDEVCLSSVSTMLITGAAGQQESLGGSAHLEPLLGEQRRLTLADEVMYLRF